MWCLPASHLPLTNPKSFSSLPRAKTHRSVAATRTIPTRKSRRNGGKRQATTFFCPKRRLCPPYREGGGGEEERDFYFCCSPMREKDVHIVRTTLSLHVSLVSFQRPSYFYSSSANIILHAKKQCLAWLSRYAFTSSSQSREDMETDLQYSMEAVLQGNVLKHP